jgi:hypothetical protein
MIPSRRRHCSAIPNFILTAKGLAAMRVPTVRSRDRGTHSIEKESLISGWSLQTLKKAWAREGRFEANTELRRGSVGARAETYRMMQMHSGTARRDVQLHEAEQLSTALRGWARGYRQSSPACLLTLTGRRLARWSLNGRATTNPTKSLAGARKQSASTPMRRCSNLPLAAVSLPLGGCRNALRE